MKKSMIAFVVVVGLGVGAFAMGMNGHGNRGGMYQLVKQLDLTVEQQKALKALKQERKAMMKQNQKAFKQKREGMKQSMQPDMSTFMSATTFDKVAFKAQMQKKFTKMQEEMQKRRDAMLEQRAEGMQKIFDILTPAQRTELIALSKAKH